MKRKPSRKVLNATQYILSSLEKNPGVSISYWNFGITNNQQEAQLDEELLASGWIANHGDWFFGYRSFTKTDPVNQ